MKLIITRHGETVENVNKVCQGQIGGKLTEKGIEEAKKLGLRFKHEKIDAIYSSDLKRAMDTSAEIIKYHPDLKIKPDKRLRERFLGVQEGKKFPENWNWKNLPKDVETNEKMCIRVKEFLDEIYIRDKNKTVILVCHAGTKLALLNVIHNKDISEFNNWEYLKNTSVSEFEINDNDEMKIINLNCTKHLD